MRVEILPRGVALDPVAASGPHDRERRSVTKIFNFIYLFIYHFIFILIRVWRTSV